MSDKQPYIPFYLGDYIKDTRVLPLNVRGGWVDIILAMWNNKKRGEIQGTYEDFSRIMSCSVEESILVIQTLIQKKICNHASLEENTFLLTSRKIKKMDKISKIRRKVGAKGGNPFLVKQKGNQNPEYENTHSVFSLRLLSKEGEIDKEAIEVSTRVIVTEELLKQFNANLTNSSAHHSHFSEYKKHLVNWIPKKPKANTDDKPEKIGRTDKNKLHAFINGTD
jgi:hypothetical protein